MCENYLCDPASIKVVHQLDQLANHADRLRAQFEVDAVISLFCLDAPCSPIVVSTNDWVFRFFVCVKNLRVGFALCRNTRFFSDPGSTKNPVPWLQACCLVTNIVSLLETQVVILVPLCL